MGKVHKKLLIGRVKMLLNKHCDIQLNGEHEIDSSLSISENYFKLKDKYEQKISICDIENL